MRKIELDKPEKNRKNWKFLLDRKEKIRRRPEYKEEENILNTLMNLKVESAFQKGEVKKFKLEI